MSHIAWIVIATWSLWPTLAWAQAPDFKLDFVQTRERTVEVTKVDPAGLAWKMGLKKDDTVLKIDTKKIEKKKDLEDALKALRGSYAIVVERAEGSGKQRRFVQRTLKGELKERSDKPGTYFILLNQGP